MGCCRGTSSIPSPCSGLNVLALPHRQCRSQLHLEFSPSPRTSVAIPVKWAANSAFLAGHAVNGKAALRAETRGGRLGAPAPALAQGSAKHRLCGSSQTTARSSLSESVWIWQGTEHFPDAPGFRLTAAPVCSWDDHPQASQNQSTCPALYWSHPRAAGCPPPAPRVSRREQPCPARVVSSILLS